MWKLIDEPFRRIVLMKSPEKTELLYDYAVHWNEIGIVVVWTALFVYWILQTITKARLVGYSFNT